MKYKKLIADVRHMKWDYLKNVPDNYRSEELFYFIPMHDLQRVYGPIYTITKNYRLFGKHIPFETPIRSAYQEFVYQPIDTPLDEGMIRYTSYLLENGDYRSNLMLLPLALSLYKGFNAFLHDVDESMEMRFNRMQLNRRWYSDINDAVKYLKLHNIVSHHTEFCNMMPEEKYRKNAFNKDHTLGNGGVQSYFYIPINQTECGYMISYADMIYLAHVQSIEIKFNSHNIELVCDGDITNTLSNCFYVIRYFEAQKWIELLNQYTITITFNNDLPEISARGVYTRETGPINIYSLLMASREQYHGSIIHI